MRRMLNNFEMRIFRRDVRHIIGASLSEPHIDELHVRNLYILVERCFNINGASLRYLCSLAGSCSSLFSFLLALSKLFCGCF